MESHTNVNYVAIKEQPM